MRGKKKEGERRRGGGWGRKRVLLGETLQLSWQLPQGGKRGEEVRRKEKEKKSKKEIKIK